MLSSFVRKILLLSTIVSTFVSIFFPLQFSDDIYNLSHQRDSIKFCVKDSATKIFLKQVKVLLMSAVFSPVRNHHNRKIFLSLSSKTRNRQMNIQTLLIKLKAFNLLLFFRTRQIHFMYTCKNLSQMYISLGEDLTKETPSVRDKFS